MPKINLLYVITKLELGGAQKQLLSLIKGLDKSRYNIFLFTAADGLLIDAASSLKYITLIKSRFLERPINPIKDLFCVFEIYVCIKKNKIQVIHTHSSKAGILGRISAALAGVDRIIHTVHGWSFNDYQPVLIRRLYTLIERRCALFTDKLVVVSYYDKEKGLNNYIGEETKYCLIRYAIDRAEFNIKDASIRRKLGIGDEDLTVGMVACFKPQKCPQDFIKLAYLIIRQMPEVKFILVGDGILRRKIERLILKYNLKENIVLTGWRTDLANVLSVFDVFVLTSLWEGLPVSVLEAIAAFKPVAATDTGGVAEVIIEGDTGFLASPRDMETLSRKLAGLLKNRELRNSIAGKAFSALNSDFNQEIVVEKTEELYYN
ncbi:MAG: glycosyltransferase family 4 protein [Candidatus Omnitrophota bacterium]|nr:glycosyltransferase family 4 protein [Candidatus Omnitrophota bacterium]MBU1928951.1 glycosyltransferase family 4 protein [Candidatus Omnitrophota bacterium]MBU2034969.1 glycosyltransferase family 4 protein [Candidatus Omnitrophota bacterium]MBU2221216.1 glycosyltransferase family 4 protein [Candidatus Omnitrophota bacterium]MBU2257922.1 glycosyltransferase family 4 protein [Candidatus Omnitrophota bacterium]